MLNTEKEMSWQTEEEKNTEPFYSEKKKNVLLDK